MKSDLQLPSFEDATDWLNRTSRDERRTGGIATLSDEVISRELKGHPTIVHFWSISSETAKNNLTHLAELRDHRKRDGLRMVAVHVPQTKSDQDSQAVLDAVGRLNLTEPCALDNSQKLTAAFRNGDRDVPAY